MSALLETKGIKSIFHAKGMLHAVDDVSMTFERGTTVGLLENPDAESPLSAELLFIFWRVRQGRLFLKARMLPIPRQRAVQTATGHADYIPRPVFIAKPAFYCGGDPERSPVALKACHEKTVDKEIERLMDMVGLARRWRMAYPHEMDGGRRQRVCIGRTLAMNPKFIVCDEPVSALDVSIQAQVLNLLEDLQKEHDLTYMFVTHDLSVVRHISDNISHVPGPSYGDLSL